MTLAEPEIGIALNEAFERTTEGLTRTFQIYGQAHRSTYRDAHDTGDDRGDWWKAFLSGQPLEVDGIRRRVSSLDLFCGPGGLALGFSQGARELGYEFVSEAAVDEDAGAVQVYAANHGARSRITRSVDSLLDFQVRGTGAEARFRYKPEITEPELADLPGRIDVVLAGPPCQGHSNLNNHTRRSDRRNDLYLTVPAFAVAVDASMVVIENVPAVIHDRRQVVAATRALLEANGYEVVTGRIHANRLGWPQTRQRFFLLASRAGTPIDPEVVEASLAEPTPRPLWWAIEEFEDAPIDNRMVLPTDFSEENVRRIDWLFHHGMYDLPNSERPECHQGGTTYNSVYGRLHKERPAPTITTGFMTPGRGRYIHPTRRRVLSPREAARIQGFPDSYDFQPDPTRASSKIQLGKWIGDAVPMPLGHAAAISVLGSRPD